MTKPTPAYHRDPYLRSLATVVTGVGQDEKLGAYVVLEDTVCHAHGGGQKGDRGALALSAEVAQAAGLPARLSIGDTRRIGEAIAHGVGTHGGLERLVGTAVTVELDWPFRWRQMRLHSTAHLLHCFVERAAERPVAYPALSDLQPDFGVNRYELADLIDEPGLGALVAHLNAFTALGHAIRTEPDPANPRHRTWTCGDWSIPCGGTHPATTAEIGPVEVTLSRRKGRTAMTFRLLE